MPSVAFDPIIASTYKPKSSGHASSHGNRPEASSPFATLLDSANPSPEPSPGPRNDRSERTEARHNDRSDDTRPAGDQRTDKPAPAKDSNDTKGAKDTKEAQETGKETGKEPGEKTGETKDADKPEGTEAGSAADSAPDAKADAVLATVEPVKAPAPTAIAALADPTAPAAAPAEAEAGPEAEQIAAIQAAAKGAAPAAALAAGAAAEAAAETKPQVAANPEAVAETDGKTEAKPDVPAASALKGAPAVTPVEAQNHDGSQTKQEHAAKHSAPAVEAPAPANVETAPRIADAAGAVKAGADAMQNLNVTAPVHHTAAAATAAPAGAALVSTPAAAAIPLAGVAVEIATHAAAGKNRFEIRLDPPELGRIDVRLDVDRDGHVTSRLIVERPETLDLLRRDAQQLERALNQAGLKTADNALEFSLRDQSLARDDGRNPQNPNRLVVPDETAAPIEAVRRYGLTGASSGLDIRV